MMKGRIAIPGRDPKTWRAKGRKRKSATVADVPVILEGVRSPAEIARAKRRAPLVDKLGRSDCPASVVPGS
jgi:hypothetical protein